MGLYALLLLALILRVTHYRAIPPLLGLYVACGILILEKWAEENDLDEDILLETSPTGYSHDELALQWLKHFEIHSRKSQVGVWRLLILDGYGSHLTYKFYEYAQKHYIELFRLPLLMQTVKVCQFSNNWGLWLIIYMIEACMFTMMSIEGGGICQI